MKFMNNRNLAAEIAKKRKAKEETRKKAAKEGKADVKR